MAALLPAVYFLVHEPTGTYYVGSTRNPSPRLADHKRTLRQGTHHNSKLQRVYNSNPVIDIVIVPVPDREIAFALEQGVLDTMDSNPRLLNINKHTGGKPEESNIRTAETMRKRVPSPAQLAALVPGKGPFLGRKHSPLTIDRMRNNTTPGTLKQISDLVERAGRKVSVNGKVYASASEAARALQVSQPTIVRWCGSPDKPKMWFI